MDKVSVIIPTYNRQNTLLRAIHSVLKQTYPVHEIIICDDGSDDDSQKIITELNNSKIKWLDCGRNGMPSIPRNKGIKVAEGEWIAFLDSDDEWVSNKIELQLKALKENGTEASSCNAFRVTAEKKEGAYLSYNKNTITFNDLISVNYIVCSSVLVSKKTLEQISLFPEGKEYKAIEDYVLWLRIATRIPFTYLSEPLVNYYDDPESTIRTNYTDVWDLRKIVFTGLLDWVEKEKVKLRDPDKKKLDFTYSEILHKGKIPIWQRVKQKFIK
ncbi:MAG TPA: glycosyltransferase [Bacteroidia bacterium]|jgi:teichuronic acid biosynthesis glycosyltransferase TuaG|nr:glycosyltransferase [Bacteroidia bacterium]